MIKELLVPEAGSQRLKEHQCFDEQANFDGSMSEINFDLANLLRLSLVPPPL